MLESKHNLLIMPEIVFVGRSNVGKSSVIRQLTGKKVRVGKRPGVTREFCRYELGGKLRIVDLPGFGFISGMSSEKQEEIKTKIVRYLEENADEILFAIEIIDSRSFLEIAERWDRRGQIPIAVELFSLLQELELLPIVVANKIDLIYPEERDEILDGICEKLGLDPPWRQWLDVIVPVSAKTGEGINELKKLMRHRFQKLNQEQLLRYLK